MIGVGFMLNFRRKGFHFSPKKIELGTKSDEGGWVRMIFWFRFYGVVPC